MVVRAVYVAVVCLAAVCCGGRQAVEDAAPAPPADASPAPPRDDAAVASRPRDAGGGDAALWDGGIGRVRPEAVVGTCDARDAAVSCPAGSTCARVDGVDPSYETPVCVTGDNPCDAVECAPGRVCGVSGIGPADNVACLVL